jgi:Lysyl oxidase
MRQNPWFKDGTTRTLNRMNPGGTRSFRLPALAFTIFLVVGMALVSGVGAAGEATPLLPDLRTRPPSQFTIDLDEPGHVGTRLLRFSNDVLNRGTGPLELGPKAEDCDENGNFDDDRTAYQHVFKDTETIDSPGEFLRMKDGSPADLFDEREAGCSMFHLAHNHWHFQDFAKYELRPMATDGPSETVVGSSDKVSFCLVDTNQVRNDLPGFSSTRYYGVGLLHCDKDEVTGISIGWSDLYSAGLADQWIDIGPKGGGIPNGTYCMISTVDPSDHLLEIKETNNSRSIRLKIKGNSVEIAQRRTCQRVAPTS